MKKEYLVDNMLWIVSILIVLLGIFGTVLNTAFWFSEKTNGRIIQAIVFMVIFLFFGIIAVKIRPNKLSENNLYYTKGKCYE